MRIEDVANAMKRDIENAIVNKVVNGSNLSKTTKKPFTNGLEAKTSLIRSSTLINHLHEFVKYEFIKSKVDPSIIFPPLHQSKPELKITGLYKQKDQDVCVKPKNINPVRTLIDWGPMVNSGLYCDYGQKLTEEIISVNIRSQLSSLAKNTDTLFERTIAEAINLHDSYPRMVLGEVYMIPVYEYDDTTMVNNQVTFKRKQTDLEKYISFFYYISDRVDVDEDKHKYERCALVIIDYSKSPAKVYRNTAELIADGLVSSNFSHELELISTEKFVKDLLEIYDERFGNTSLFI
ncbi:restriction endonuclease [Sporosarcina sp. P26b]|uniref:restriction endonuclease n=1 Tax=Sporosarcina sp. P26b TaxID=2048253 RepID=UPI000C170726|nr:restriction endonuclease [Sporosarcina sp. P26b]PIC94832.1 restriction endonuclease [Sporosarcina sp. P26b]